MHKLNRKENKQQLKLLLKLQTKINGHIINNLNFYT